VTIFVVFGISAQPPRLIVRNRPKAFKIVRSRRVRFVASCARESLTAIIAQAALARSRESLNASPGLKCLTVRVPQETAILSLRVSSIRTFMGILVL
jgi:hypothetical protein